MNTAELRELDIHFIQPTSTVHNDYRPIKIRVYKNGDEQDKGKEFPVTRREFKHWIIFLDGLTQKLRSSTAIHRLYTIQGIPVEHFDELEHKGEYVAVEKGNFIHCRYGKANNWARERKWKSLGRVDIPKPVFLESAETMDIYLRREGYGSITGLPYPFDGILTRSPSTSALHLKSHHTHLRKFGSVEKLSKYGHTVWSHEMKKTVSKEKLSNIPKLPPLCNLGDDSDVRNEENNNEKKTIDQETSTKRDKTTSFLPPIEPEKEQNPNNNQSNRGGNINNSNNNNSLFNNASGKNVSVNIQNNNNNNSNSNNNNNNNNKNTTTNKNENQVKEETKENKTNNIKEVDKLPPINAQSSRESRIPIKKVIKREMKTYSARPTWSDQNTYESKEYRAEEILAYKEKPQLPELPEIPSASSSKPEPVLSIMKQSISVPLLKDDDDLNSPRTFMTRREREASQKRIRRQLPLQRSDSSLIVYDEYDPDFANY